MSKLQIGDKAPSINAIDQNENSINLESYRGKKVVLYFYPKDNTSGCTTESIEFQGLKEEFEKLNTKILGISRDSIKSHEKFKDKYDFSFDLISDENEEICKAFDVIKEKNMYGKKYLGIERSTFLIDEENILIAEWRKVKAKGHAQIVLDHIADL
jgi:peroxiredoxin Q/BCP